MSHIPKSARPHAGPEFEGGGGENGKRTSISERAGRAAEVARENPRTSIAAGAAMIVGAIAAAALPFLRSRSKASINKATNGAGKGNASTAKKAGGTAKKSMARQANAKSTKAAGDAKATVPKSSAQKRSKTPRSKAASSRNTSGSGEGRTRKSGAGTRLTTSES